MKRLKIMFARLVQRPAQKDIRYWQGRYLALVEDLRVTEAAFQVQCAEVVRLRDRISNPFPGRHPAVTEATLIETPTDGPGPVGRTPLEEM